MLYYVNIYMIIYIDIKRISQVIGNIISNSYKYAGTRIEVEFRIVEGYLEMSLTDFVWSMVCLS